SVTADGAAHVAMAGVAHGTRLIHVSSDVLHSGRTRPYLDDDPPSPLHAYGQAKADAEALVIAADPSAVLVPTPLLVCRPPPPPGGFFPFPLRRRRPGAPFLAAVPCPP